jgi:molybdopterin converting factor small subunit
MSAKVIIPPIMQPVTHGLEAIDVRGSNVGDCIEDLIRQYPEAKDWFNPDNPIVWMVLNQNIINFDELDTKVSEGEHIDLILVIGGG